MSLLGGILGSVVGGLFGDKQADRAADAQVRASQMAVDEQRRQYDQTRTDYAPYREVGTGALNQLAAQFGVPGSTPQQAAAPSYTFDPNTGQFSMQGGGQSQPAPAAAQPNAFFQSPGYEFRRNEGMRGLEQTAAARGGAFSGNALRGLSNFNSGLASQEYGNYINGLQSLAGVGQSSTNATAGFGAQAAGNIGNALISSGEARASGIVGGANALSQGLSGAIDQWNYFRNGPGALDYFTPSASRQSDGLGYVYPTARRYP